MPTVFSPRFDVKTRLFSFETRTPATPGRPGIERTYTSLFESITSTESFEVCATYTVPDSVWTAAWSNPPLFWCSGNAMLPMRFRLEPRDLLRLGGDVVL